MKKSSHVQIINRSHGVAILFSMTMGSCHAGDYEIKENCAPIDTCGDGIDNDCKNGIDDGCDCMTIGEKRPRIPVLPGKDPLQLTFGPSSACQLDTEVCKDQNGDGKYKWVSQGTGRGPLASTDVTCDGKDDDCDGKIDEEFTSGAQCLSPGNATGKCKTVGITYGCNPTTNKAYCSAQDRTPSPVTTYYSYPYIIGSSNPTFDWDWDCVNGVNLVTCQGSALNNLSTIDSTNANYISYCKYPALPIYPVAYSSPLCGSCSSTNPTYWQFSTSASLTAPPVEANCGNIYPIVQCNWSGGASTTCNVTKSDSLIILCK